MSLVQTRLSGNAADKRNTTDSFYVTLATIQSHGLNNNKYSLCSDCAASESLQCVPARALAAKSIAALSATVITQSAAACQQHIQAHAASFSAKDQCAGHQRSRRPQTHEFHLCTFQTSSNRQPNARPCVN